MQNDQLAPTQTKTRRRLTIEKAAGLELLGLGAAALITSIAFTSSILALIGLGLLFWGMILAYIQTEEYVKGSLLAATALPSLATLNQIMQELSYEGKAVYLPPKYLKDPESNRAYIPKYKEGKLPSPEQIQTQEAKMFIEEPEGILLTPPGAELAKLFEKTLETSFTKIDLQHFEQKMPKIFIEDLEIARNFETTSQNDIINVKIEDSPYKNLFLDTQRLSKVNETLGSPLASAIACALTKATGKPILIENERTSNDGKRIEINYRALQEEQK